MQTSWQNGADAMPVKLVLYFVDIVKVLSTKTDGPATVRSPLQLFNIVKPLGSKTDGPATVRSPLQLFNIVKLPGSKTDGPATAILHCEGFQRYTVQRPTALLLYVVKALFCGTRFEDRRPGCYRSTSDLLLPIHFANQHWTCCRSCHTTLWTLSKTCCYYRCYCTPIAIYW